MLVFVTLLHDSCDRYGPAVAGKDAGWGGRDSAVQSGREPGMAQSTVERAVATAPPVTMSEEMVIRLALQAEPAPDRWEGRFHRLIETGVKIGPNAESGYGSSRCPGNGPTPVVVRGPVEPNSIETDGICDRSRTPDIYFLLNESVLGLVQSGSAVTVKSPGNSRSRRVDAREWWLRFMNWLSLHTDASLAIAGLEERSPTKATTAMIDPFLGQLTRPGTAAVVLDLDLARLVNNNRGLERSLMAEIVPTLVRLADNLLCASRWPTPLHLKNAVTRRMLRLNLGGVFRATEKLGVNPTSYKGLQKVEGLIGEVSKLASASSMTLAAERGPCLVPAHSPLHVAGHLFSEPERRNGQLTSISPFAFLPPDRDRHRAYLDLLPAIRLTDCVGWRRPSAVEPVDAADLAVLYRLTWAVRRAA
jgi:hypothetical protein